MNVSESNFAAPGPAPDGVAPPAPPADHAESQPVPRMNDLLRVTADVLGSTDLPGLLQRVADAARELTGARLATCGHGFQDDRFQLGAASRAPGMPPCPPGENFRVVRGGVHLELVGALESLRLTDQELRARPDWWGLPEGHVGLRGLLGARLSDAAGRTCGLILASDKEGGGEFTAADESLMRQLAALTSLALRHIDARAEAEARAQALRELNQTLEQRVAERTALAERRARQLRALALDLTQAEERERRRLAKVLHDGLQQWLVAARMHAAGLQGRTTVAALQDGARQVERLIQDAITVSRSLMVELSPPALYDNGFRAVLDWLAGQMLEKHELVVEVRVEEGAEPQGTAMRVLLFQAARELLFNVVKHAGVAAAQVRLWRPQPGEIALTVEDPGRGFDAAAAKPDARATGLGLFSIGERLAALGGRIEVRSAPGQGTSITLLVPLIAPREAHASAAATPDGEAPAGPPAAPREAQRGPDAAGPPTAPAGGPGVRILLADDHKIVREGLSSVLRAQPGLTVVAEAANGAEILDLARRLRPDVIVMDVAMPNLSGIEATRRLTAEMPGLKVIGLSMFDEEDFADEMRAAGAVAYLNKAGPTHELVATIRRCVGVSGRMG